MLVGVGGKDTESVVEALSDQIRRLPKTMIDTLTWDWGCYTGTDRCAHRLNLPPHF